MIVYKSKAEGFIRDVEENRIVPEIEEAFVSKFGRQVALKERRSWNNSLQFMERVVRSSGIPEDCGILIEYVIPSTSRRIDFIISGHDEDGSTNFVIVELKQWEKAYATEKEELVQTFLGNNVRETPHPSYQAFSYKKFLSDMNQAVYENELNPYSCAYLHNYQKRNPEPLIAPQYQDIIEDTPIFFSEDNRKLESFINRYVGKGDGLDILYTIENGKIKPSKSFVDYVLEVFEGNEVFTLLDEQKVAYENIISNALSAKDKTTIIVDGGPGTGKSVVAVNALVELLKYRMNIKFVGPNAAFRDSVVEKISNNKQYPKRRLNALFSGSSSFYKASENEFDVLIVDEAHRLKNDLANFYWGENQIEDIINASKINVFFIDDNQRIRPEDIGTVENTKRVAERYDSEVIGVKLESQFRCSGAEGFLNWLDHNLQIKDTANYDGWDENDFEFKIFDSPYTVVEKIKEKNKDGYYARVLAGYAWRWTSQKQGNPDAEVEDVEIPEHEFSMPWNSRKVRTTWAMDSDKIDQIGCIHTSQGLEFNYVGVIVGYDLRYDPETNQVYGSYEDYYDNTGKKGLKSDPEQLTLYIKNIYKTLMTRGMKGCYVFCRDINLQEYLKSRLKFNQQ